jgi:hypothetical protein
MTKTDQLYISNYLIKQAFAGMAGRAAMGLGRKLLSNPNMRKAVRGIGQGLGSFRQGAGQLFGATSHLGAAGADLGRAAINASKTGINSGIGAARSGINSGIGAARSGINSGIDAASNFIKDNPLKSIAAAGYLGSLNNNNGTTQFNNPIPMPSIMPSLQQ